MAMRSFDSRRPLLASSNRSSAISIGRSSRMARGENGFPSDLCRVGSDLDLWTHAGVAIQKIAWPPFGTFGHPSKGGRTSRKVAVGSKGWPSRRKGGRAGRPCVPGGRGNAGFPGAPAELGWSAWFPARSFYITTPIYYPSDVPHIGHGYTEVAVDALARWHRQAGDDTWMLTGTDEHGQKMLRAAAANGDDPAGVGRPARQRGRGSRCSRRSTSPTTTSSARRRSATRSACRRSCRRCYDTRLHLRGRVRGALLRRLRGVQAAESEIVDGTGPFEGLKVCAIHSQAARAAAGEELLLQAERVPGPPARALRGAPRLRPARESARNEVVSFVKQRPRRTSRSRARPSTGASRCPWDESHVIYVWVDALLNYATAVGYGRDEEEFARRWPAYHVVGKDILRFHAVIWPAMLMAAGRRGAASSVFAHGWLLVGGEKMSKSKLTGIAPTEITDVFGSDAFRYYFLSAIAFGQDGSFSLGGPLRPLPGRARQRLRQPRLAHRSR